ncbi:hypothetical protein NEOLEDRAFT_1179290 [Neolentinus lepideus HHB14362 ss-1]|uniref:HMG box domain-containing protein n=1 Tax=Neolentinus lepideus HHB14362 ss-1 TaxID=1314782 RepID=A0A165RUN3_9AGAM|nr:hypothetical protein NEOLEDRAFT_1179290 [Neolentinus lepideus HHB14362 ss-1]
MPAQRTRDTPTRSLEVTTDAPLPPTVSIVAPTPRVATFPANASPSPTPSVSPFDPNVNPFATAFTSTSSPTPSIARTLSPTESVSSDSSTPSATGSSKSTSSHKRQASTHSVPSDITSERRPKKGEEGYVKRPENAFILFRRKCCEERKEQLQQLEQSDAPSKRQRQADLSKLISQQWKSLPAEERVVWEDLAKEKKKEHEKMYPGYVYRPQRSKRRTTKGNKGLGEEELNLTDGESVPLTLHAPAMRGHGRSSSAPTPPPGYCGIRLPTVPTLQASCPSSPYLTPMISHRAHAPSQLHQSTTHYDFFSDESMPLSSFQYSSNSYGFGLIPNENSMLLPPLALPHDYQLISPAETIASVSSGPPSPQHCSPFTPQSIDSALPATGIHEPHPTSHTTHPSWMHSSEIDMDVHMHTHDMQTQYHESGGCGGWETREMPLWPQGVGVGMVDEFEGLELELGLPNLGGYNGGASSSSQFSHSGDDNDALDMFTLEAMDYPQHNGSGSI